MIQSLIFDMGNTLLAFDPERYISQRVPDARPSRGKMQGVHKPW